jgi:6,7-dimethyl-8-ribityllumazine synthase
LIGRLDLDLSSRRCLPSTVGKVGKKAAERLNTCFTLSPPQAAESEVSFEELDGSSMRIGIIKTRWNREHVDNLVGGIEKALAECKVSEENIFQTSVPGSYELPMAARFLALSGTVDAIICTGVLIKGETMHFEYIADAVAKGIMNVAIQTSTPIVFGVLTCLNEKQVKARSSGNTNHGYDWGKTAVEMALLRTEALGGKAADTPLKELGFGLTAEKKEKEKAGKPGFF